MKETVITKNMKHKILSIDLETYSDVPIDYGVYRYTDSDQFEILLCGYAFDDEEPTVIDLANGETLPQEFIDALKDPDIEKHAYNASFERICLSRYLNQSFGTFLSPFDGWWCTLKHAAMMGLPNSLADVGKVLGLEEQKDRRGKALIDYFCKPCRPTQSNSGRTRNLPKHDMEKWEIFKSYNRQDVISERAISQWLDSHYPEEGLEDSKYDYRINEAVNDNGVLIDMQLVNSILKYYQAFTEEQQKRAKDLTGLDNPNSLAQLKTWLKSRGFTVQSITKDTLPDIVKQAQERNDSVAEEVLTIRTNLSKTSTKKYEAMKNCVCSDGRIHGVMNYYGANRTGRFAARLIQVQNLPRNYLSEIDVVRTLVKNEDWETIEDLYDDIPDLLKQLIRTAIVAPAGDVLSVADFSAIEARVIAWEAGETETQKIFAPGGSQKIYEGTAAAMFGVPIETIAKGKENYALRQRGKVATLACGYGGGVGAMRRMDTGHKLDSLSDSEVRDMVNKWRKSHPHIVKWWSDLENACRHVIEYHDEIHVGKFKFRHDGQNLFIRMPSGRWITYFNCRIDPNGTEIVYGGTDTKGWSDDLRTYSGKLAENVTQAVARDCLCGAIRHLYESGYKIIFHVHDEIICEVPDQTDTNGDNPYMKNQEKLMTQNIGTWDDGIYHPAPGFTSKYYMKD